MSSLPGPRRDRPGLGRPALQVDRLAARLEQCPHLKFVAFLGIGYASCIDIQAATRLARSNWSASRQFQFTSAGM